MNSNFLDSGIRALHSVVVTTRYMGYKNTDPRLLARMLDHADALGFMLMDDFRDFEGEETPILFRRHLQGIEDAFDGFEHLVAKFDQDMKRANVSRELVGANA